MVQTFLRKEIKVKALEWTGENSEEVKKFVSHKTSTVLLPSINKILFVDKKLYLNKHDHILIKEEDGTLDVCKKEVFEKEYELCVD